MKKLVAIAAAGKKVTINWFFEEGDDDMREAGEDLESMFDMQFNFREVPEIKVLGGVSEQQKVA